AKVTLSTYCTEWRGGRCAGWSTQHDIRGSENCGDYHNGRFVSAADHNPAVHGHDGAFALRSSSRRCHLGGSDELWNEFVADDGRGAWLPWRGPVHPKLRALRADADFLWPISRPNNPEFRGVIFVDGKVLVSGTVRGRVTVAATSDIVVGDDIIYATDPGAGSCEDIAGYFSGKKVVLSDNLLNAPAQVPGSSTYYTFDESASEFLHGVVLALDVFTVEDYSSGPTSAQYCEGKRAGRGCIYLSGGIVQSTRGAVGLPDGHGYVIRHSYDRCAATRPPPHFPTTGTFLKGQYYQVDPAGFDVEAFFSPIPPVGLAN
ncbi:MAG: hypothetical protein KJN92_11685, partial [Gemmatimonadetes bacterium]|nr:hypothetical protein [Gemmatimonadota bacterium]